MSKVLITKQMLESLVKKCLQEINEDNQIIDREHIGNGVERIRWRPEVTQQQRHERMTSDWDKRQERFQNRHSGMDPLAQPRKDEYGEYTDKRTKVDRDEDGYVEYGQNEFGEPRSIHDEIADYRQKRSEKTPFNPRQLKMFDDKGNAINVNEKRIRLAVDSVLEKYIRKH